jgi:hypothetical protein
VNRLGNEAGARDGIISDHDDRNNDSICKTLDFLPNSSRLRDRMRNNSRPSLRLVLPADDLWIASRGLNFFDDMKSNQILKIVD